MEYETIMRAGGGRGWLLLVHGMLASRALWAPNLARLGAAHNLVLVDLPAHGATAAAGWGRGAGPETWHPDGMVARLDAIRAELGIARWAVCGQSFGAVAQGGPRHQRAKRTAFGRPVGFAGLDRA